MPKHIVFLCGICLFFSGVTAATPTSDQHNPASQPIPQQNNGDFKFSGYIDASYNYLLRSNQFISGVNNRVFDLADNGFTLQQAALAVSKQPDQGFGGLVNVIVGRDASGIAPDGFDSNVFDTRDIGLAIPEAYLQYSIKTITIFAGELLSLAGFEQYDYTEDTNFSRSILFGYAQPGTHVGLRVSDKINDQFNLIAGINNGWNTIHQPTHLNTLELRAIYTLGSTFSVTIDGYAGQQRLTDNLETGPSGMRYLLDIFGTWSVTERLSFAMNYDYGTQNKAQLSSGNIGRANWQGIAGYANYKWDEKWRTSLRGEIFADTDGYRTGVKQNWREITLTLGYIPIKNVEISAEMRHDFANVASFLDKNGIGTSNNQQSYALAALYNFG